MQQLQVASQKHSANWLKIFPREIKTLTGSTIFVKQLTALAFSCITYMRSVFPEYAYEHREIDDVKVKVLSGNYDCKDAYLMTRWIKSAFNALDNKYMRELILEILSVDNEPLEYYSVVYKYNENGPSCSFSTSGKTKDIDFDVIELQNATKELITTLLNVTESLGKLPSKYILQLRVNYYDEITPAHYKPKYFNHAEACDLQKIEGMKNEVIGSVETPYLALSLYCGSKLVSLDDSQQIFFKDLEEENSQQIIEETEVNVEECSSEIISASKQTKPEDEIKKQESEPTWNFDKSANSEDNPSTRNDVESSSRPDTSNCICGHDFESGKKSLNDSSKTFKCFSCGTCQHLVCYKKVPECRELDSQICYFCAKSGDNSSVECTDPSLMKYNAKQAKHLALYRQLLYRFHNKRSINFKTLDELSIKDDLAENMVSKLLQESFVKPKKNSKDVFLINTAKIKHFVKFYFKF